MKNNEDGTKNGRGDIHKVEILPHVSLLSERTSLINKNKNKTIQQQQHNRLTLALIFFAVGGLLFTGVSYGGLAKAQTTTTDDTDPTTRAIIDTQQSAVSELTNDERQVGDLKFQIRWSPVTTTEADTMTAIFADCDNGEFAVSSMQMYENEDLTTVQSFPIALPGDLMSWLTVVHNSGSEALQASTGVLCVEERADGEDRNADDDINLDTTTRITIQNTINRLIQEGDDVSGGGNTFVNVNHITQVYQNIVQNAVQIINVTGNNNTVNAIINQSANQIVESGGANVNQTISQNAQQVIGANVTSTTAPGPVTNTTTTTSPLASTLAEQRADVSATDDEATSANTTATTTTTNDASPRVREPLTGTDSPTTTDTTTTTTATEEEPNEDPVGGVTDGDTTTTTDSEPEVVEEPEETEPSNSDTSDGETTDNMDGTDTEDDGA